MAKRTYRVRYEVYFTVEASSRDEALALAAEKASEARQWTPGKPSPNRLDAEVWLYTGLGLAASGNLLLFGGGHAE